MFPALPLASIKRRDKLLVSGVRPMEPINFSVSRTVLDRMWVGIFILSIALSARSVV